MINREYREREFSDSIDRMLAGESVDLGRSPDEDFRTALDFARTMVSARPQVRARFETELKARLLHRLAETEEKRRIAGQNWLRRLVRQPVWQAAAVAVFLVIAVTALWATGVFRQEPGETIPPGTVLAVSGDTNKNAYAAGELVDIEISLKNVTEEPFTVDKFPPILSLMRTDTGEAVYTFGAGSGTVTLNPGQEKDFSVTWDQRDARGMNVPAGGYYLELEDIEYQGQALQLKFTRTVSFNIRPPPPS